MTVLVIWVVLKGTQETEHVFWFPPNSRTSHPGLDSVFYHFSAYTEIKPMSPGSAARLDGKHA